MIFNVPIHEEMMAMEPGIDEYGLMDGFMNGPQKLDCSKLHITLTGKWRAVPTGTTRITSTGYSKRTASVEAATTDDAADTSHRKCLNMHILQPPSSAKSLLIGFVILIDRRYSA